MFLIIPLIKDLGNSKKLPYRAVFGQIKTARQGRKLTQKTEKLGFSKIKKMHLFWFFFYQIFPFVVSPRVWFSLQRVFLTHFRFIVFAKCFLECYNVDNKKQKSSADNYPLISAFFAYSPDGRSSRNVETRSILGSRWRKKQDWVDFETKQVLWSNTRVTNNSSPQAPKNYKYTI